MYGCVVQGAIVSHFGSPFMSVSIRKSAQAMATCVSLQPLPHGAAKPRQPILFVLQSPISLLPPPKGGNPLIGPGPIPCSHCSGWSSRSPAPALGAPLPRRIAAPVHPARKANPPPPSAESPELRAWDVVGPNFRYAVTLQVHGGRGVQLHMIIKVHVAGLQIV